MKEGEQMHIDGQNAYLCIASYMRALFTGKKGCM